MACTLPERSSATFALTSMPGKALAEWALDKSHIAAPGFRWLAALLWMFSRSYEKSGSLVNGLSVEVQGNRAEQHPLVYTRFEVCYSVRGTNIAPQAVVRAIELSTTRYCPVIRLLGKVAPVTTRHIIE
ncbi:MAG: hypothetical protein ACJ8AG_21235 [Ktedonobacteraceae bacterium]